MSLSKTVIQLIFQTMFCFIVLIFEVASVFPGGLSLSSSCQDIDTAACQLMVQRNADICNNVAVAETACSRFCNLCAKTCYLCENAVRDRQDCNQTTTCGMGERCYLRTVTSSRDGHMEYMMGCSTITRCDGVGVDTIIGKRDVSFHCCSDDFCNDPFGRHTTTTPSATPTTRGMPTTTVSAGCVRDVLFMMSTSNSISNINAHKVLDFMSQVIQHFDVGKQYALFALASYGLDVHEKIDFRQYHSKSELLSAISHVKDFHGTGDHIDYNDVIRYITAHKTDGDRSNVLTKAVIFIDHKDISRYLSTLRHFPKFGNDVIVVTIGIDANGEAFSQLVPDPNHRLHVDEYGGLNSIEERLLSLICA